MRILFSILFCFLTGCESVNDIFMHSACQPFTDFILNRPTLPAIQKIRAFKDSAEATPIIWNGRLLVVDSGLNVRDPFTDELISNYPLASNEFGLVCAIVSNGQCYVFGSTGLNLFGYETQPGNKVMMMQSSDLRNWSTPIEVYKAPSDRAVYNTSVAPCPGGFVMCMEIRDSSTHEGWFSERFAFSSDLKSFSDIGGILHPNSYSSCPSIRYVGGFYYVIHDEALNNGGFESWSAFVSRSLDLIHWQDQRKDWALLAPFNGPDFERHNGNQASCNSDVDLVEWNGSVYLVYDFGDQKTWGGEGLAKFDGTMQEMFGRFTFGV